MRPPPHWLSLIDKRRLIATCAATARSVIAKGMLADQPLPLK